MKTRTKSLSLLFFVLIILGTVFLRTVFLDRVLPGIINDELKFVFNAKAVWLTGTSAYGGWNIFYLNGDPHGFYDNETLPAVMAPFIGPLPYSLYNVRFAFALFSIATVGLLYVISRKLFNQSAALVIAAVAMVNPYLILMGRLGDDPPIAMFFFLLGLTLLFFLDGWAILFAFIPFFLGFYGYEGTKVSFLPFALVVTIWFAIFNKKKYRTQYLVLFVLCAILVGTFIFRLPHLATGGRVGELVTPSSHVIIEQVDNARKAAFVSPLTGIFINKFTIWLAHVAKNYADAFNPVTLFAIGENSSQISFWYHGYFYFIDGLVLLFGIGMLFKKQPKILALLLGIAAVVPLVGALRTDQAGSFVSHGTLMYPILLLIIGYGLYSMLQIPWKGRTLLAVFVVLLYTASVASFLYLYFMRMPLYNAEGPQLSRRILARYIALEKTKADHIYIYSYDPQNTFYSYLLYTSSYNTKQEAETVRSEIHKAEKTGIYSLENVSFTNESSPKKAFGSKDTIIYGDTVGEDAASTHMNIPNITTGAAVYRIYNGQTCKTDDLQRYPQQLRFSLLSIERLSEGVFCKTFITKY